MSLLDQGRMSMERILGGTFMKKTVIASIVLIAIGSTLLSLASCATGREPLPGGTRVIAYIRTWPIPEPMRDGNNPFWTAAMIPGQYITDLVISFALLCEEDVSSLYIPEYPEFNVWGEVAALQELHPELRIHIALGGGYAGGEGFSRMAANPAKRGAFVQNIVDMLYQRNLDGVDLNWEFPVGAPWDEPRRPQDARNGGPKHQRHPL